MGTESHIVAKIKEAYANIEEAYEDALKTTVIAYWEDKQPDFGTHVYKNAPIADGVEEKLNNNLIVIWRNTASIDDSDACCSLCPHQKEDEGTLYQSTFWRGNGDDLKIQQMIESCDKTEADFIGRIAFNNFRAAIYTNKNEDGNDHSFMLAPVIPHEGDELGKRIRLARKLIGFLSEQVGLDLVRVCVLKGARDNRRKYSGNADNLTRQAEILISNLENEFDNKIKFIKDNDIDFEIENAVKRADLIIPYGGSTGNILARLFTYSCKDTKLWAIPWFQQDKAWPIGEGGFIDYTWLPLTEPIKRAAMWKILGDSK